MAYTHMEYGHWGITVSTRENKGDYAAYECKFFCYAAGIRGPIDDADVERAAIAHCRSLGGEVKGPFFYKE